MSISGTDKSSFVRVLLLVVAILTIAVCVFSPLRTPKHIGFDFWDSFESARSLLVWNRSYHDPHREQAPLDIQLSSLSRIPEFAIATYNGIDKKRVDTIQSQPALGVWAFLPYLKLDIEQAYHIHSKLQIILWFLSGVILLVYSKGPNLGGGRQGAYVAVIFLTLLCAEYLHSPVESNISWGQTNIHLIFCTTLFLVLYLAQKHCMAGFILAFAVALKLAPLLFLCVVRRSDLKRLFLGLCSGLVFLFVIIFCYSGKQFLYDLIQYPFIAKRSNYNVFGSALWGSITGRSSMSPSLVFAQLQYLLGGNLVTLLGTYVAIIGGILLAFYKVILPRHLAFLAACCSGVILTSEQSIWSQVLLFLWGMLLLYEVKKSDLVYEMKTMLLFSIVLAVATPILFRVTWNHHLVFGCFSLFVLLIYNNFRSFRVNLFIFAAAICFICSDLRLNFATLSWNDATFYDPESIRFGTLGLLCTWLALDSVVGSYKVVVRD